MTNLPKKVNFRAIFAATLLLTAISGFGAKKAEAFTFGDIVCATPPWSGIRIGIACRLEDFVLAGICRPCDEY